MEIGATAKLLKIEERQRALTKFDQTGAAKFRNHTADVNLCQSGGVGDVMLTQRESMAVASRIISRSYSR